MNFTKSYMLNDNFLTKLKIDCKKRNPRKNCSERYCLIPTQDNPINLEDAPSPELCITIDQPEEIHKIHSDGCLFKEGKPPSRCDWIIYCKKNKKLLFIELKSEKYASNCIKQFISSVHLVGNNEGIISCCVLVCRTKGVSEIEKEMVANKLNFISLNVKPYDKKIHITLTKLLKKLSESTNQPPVLPK